mmetsp:Transcript_4545/g.5742  ORF Transcript_4545/g.5742 Transcript_4545/m.5742 type:complete len:99 (+) Transcript_4545:790-1086(+)
MESISNKYIPDTPKSSGSFQDLSPITSGRTGIESTHDSDSGVNLNWTSSFLTSPTNNSNNSHYIKREQVNMKYPNPMPRNIPRPNVPPPTPPPQKNEM